MDRQENICQLEDILKNMEKLLRRIEAYSYANYLEQLIERLHVDENDAISPL
ncbi:MAG: hypothetical protein ACYC27_03865 [Armatimonadota bacterium]